MSVRKDGDTIKLPGGGPNCPKCGGPTYRVAEEDAVQPWWCPKGDGCNLRVASDGTARGYTGGDA